MLKHCYVEGQLVQRWVKQESVITMKHKRSVMNAVYSSRPIITLSSCLIRLSKETFSVADLAKERQRKGRWVGDWCQHWWRKREWRWWRALHGEPLSVTTLRVTRETLIRKMKMMNEWSNCASLPLGLHGSVCKMLWAKQQIHLRQVCLRKRGTSPRRCSSRRCISTTAEVGQVHECSSRKVSLAEATTSVVMCTRWRSHWPKRFRRQWTMLPTY